MFEQRRAPSDALERALSRPIDLVAEHELSWPLGRRPRREAARLRPSGVMPFGCRTAARALRSRRSPRGPSRSYPEGHERADDGRGSTRVPAPSPMQATTRSVPPQQEPRSMSIPRTRRRRCAFMPFGVQPIAACAERRSDSLDPSRGSVPAATLSPWHPDRGQRRARRVPRRRCRSGARVPCATASRRGAFRDDAPSPGRRFGRRFGTATGCAGTTPPGSSSSGGAMPRSGCADTGSTRTRAAGPPRSTRRSAPAAGSERQDRRRRARGLRRGRRSRGADLVDACHASPGRAPLRPCLTREIRPPAQARPETPPANRRRRRSSRARPSPWRSTGVE